MRRCYTIPSHLTGTGHLAMAAAIWHNTHIGVLRKRSLIAYDH